MATSSGNGGKRPNAKSPGKADKQNRKTQGDDSDKICGFHPLRSLRNIFFGYRTRGKPSVDEDVETSAKTKSTDDIVQQIHHQHHQQQNDEPTRAVIHTPVTANNSANPIHRLSKASIPMVKQLSKSADNLMDPAEWIPAPHGIPSAVTSPCGSSEDSNLNESLDEIDVLDANSVDEFFTNKWSEVRNSRTRAFSSGDVEGTNQEQTFDLDSVHQTKALDVSVAKNRISVKPKGKRVTVAMQQKILRAEASPKPTRSYHLQSLTEADEDVDEGKKTPRTPRLSASVAAAAVAEASDETPTTPDRPIRREKRLQPAPDKSGRITINITPDMLAGARKKAGDRGANNLQTSANNLQNSATTNPRPKVGPPPPTCPKKRRTVCEPEGATGVQEDKKKETSGEEPAQNGAALGVSILRRPLLSLIEDEVVTVEEGGAAPIPKAPPRVRPKTRPKTMLHSSGAPQKTEPEPEWVTRANKKNPLVD